MAKKKTEEQVIEKAAAQEETSLVNAGLKVSVRDVLQKREEDRLKRDAERAMRAANPSGTRISRLRIKADVPYFLKFLHDFDKGLELFVHNYRGDEPCNEICKIHYGEVCDICATVGSQYGESRHTAVKCFIAWVYNDVGETFTKTNERTGEKKTFNLNPIKLVQVQLGKQDANVGVLQTAWRKKFFLDDIWLIERKKGVGGGFLPPKSVDYSEFRRMIGRDVPEGVSEAASRINDGNKLEVMTIILSCFDNVQWEKLGLERPSAISPALAEISEKGTKTEQTSQDDGLL